MVFNLSKTRSVANVFVSELRDNVIQQDSMRFRRNMERLGEFFAFEISKEMGFSDAHVQTPLGTATCQRLMAQPVLATILRAGLPLHQGLLNIFDRADSAFVSAYRKNNKSGGFVIKLEHISSPDLTSRTVIMADPMLATGMSMVLCCKELIAGQKIGELHVVSAIASTEGIAYVRAHLPKAKIWVGAIDDEMTSKAYIVPGLGDAGDLAFGTKI
ncbi:uracil phosphoribosyltransferase [Pedobacter sp. SYP-B3415]|uniref:uracil phosphoribosyltransferase n=1 Tax=Pedobacter sp. SYP-B3415 TaxID=2496641 RepID=UPI00101DE5F5|nr:uracil phosphoribosyltransferase [Pedobacter sp. SYP-B3415]